MNPLVKKVITDTGLPQDQVEVVIQSVADYVKEKYPLLTGTIDMILEQQDASHVS
ncbi:hypothetical protein SAMN05444008_103108 [Cnuella takakiae]|uniref:Uncharacterized protein n=1 Tax=Cnuella takakiae TaxID=1302690 RepID=A0A1M4WQZ5_9BACT|nr:hypothetical protein [Cnuella takakiae]SHE83567.1 hypothetical protein SAMN05444008_103108 [Cnuella takakiae]